MVRTTIGEDRRFYEHQDDAVLNQVNPVSGTQYPVLDDTYVRIINIMGMITWAANQPTPLEVHITADGNQMTFKILRFCAIPIALLLICFLLACNRRAIKVIQNLRSLEVI